MWFFVDSLPALSEEARAKLQQNSRAQLKKQKKTSSQKTQKVCYLDEFVSSALWTNNTRNNYNKFYLLRVLNSISMTFSHLVKIHL